MQKRLKNICKLYYGKNLPEKEFQNGDYPVCGANGIIGYHNQFTHTNEMLLVSCRGENSGVIHISPPYSFITNNSIICEFETDDVDTKFLYFFLKSQKREKLTSGSAQPQITTFDLGRFKLPDFPPKPEQTAIATLLSKVDEAIAVTQNSIKAAEKLKKALMQNLLTGKLKPDGSWRSEDEFYEDEKFGKVPKGWEVARVKDYGFVQTGKTPPTAEPNVFSETENETRFPFITPGDLGVSKYISVSERYVTEKGIRHSFKVPSNSVCVVCIGSTIGKIGITKIDSCTNQQINTLIANDNNSGEFFYYMMEYRKPHFKEIAGINATPQINKSGFEKYKLLRPTSKVEQEEIVLKIKSTDEEFMTKQTKIQTLQRLKKSLMQNLLAGKVRLPKAFIAQFEAVEEINNTIKTI
ncbi:restriction endonuclease subunit S [Riemerella anatipestifer]|uniref:restriction endonuclease subunit S n=1 Tax=Riemerella anatipestifer TaxID=34085 RepID=UPI00129E141E|nr:restriction endonuclease subunit S [Riemerella anatipestifer]MRM84007.1 restriction endonuclease subunit S [Riemerella anatipestifer]